MKEQGNIFIYFYFICVYIYTYCAHMGANECSLLLANPGIWSSCWWYESNANGPKLRFNTAWLFVDALCVRILLLVLFVFLLADEDEPVIVVIIPYECAVIIIICKEIVFCLPFFFCWYETYIKEYHWNKLYRITKKKKRKTKQKSSMNVTISYVYGFFCLFIFCFFWQKTAKAAILWLCEKRGFQIYSPD